MQILDDLDLPHLAIEDAAFGRNPYPYFAAARAKHPWLAKSNFGFLIHDFQAIREIYAYDDKLRCSFDEYLELMGAKGTPWGRFTQEMIMVMPVEQHRTLRATLASKFTPRIANQLRPVMRAAISRLLDEWVPKGQFNFEEFASYFPISVMFNVIGAPVQEIANIRHSLELLGLGVALDKSQLPVLQNAYLQIENLVVRLVAERRENPNAGSPEDLLSWFIATEQSGGIDNRQLVDMLIFLFVAGFDTSKNMLTFIMYTLLDYPKIYERCAVDLDYCQKVVEEGLRYFNPGITPRITTEEIVFRDVLIPKDTPLLFTLNISGRDPRAFDDPDKFDPERPIESDKRQIAFGLGKHMCLGQHIARAQIQEGFHLISQRMRNPRLAGEVGWRPFPSTWGLKGLPIAFTPAEANKG